MMRGARTIAPPNASPIAWWPRQTPRIGIAPAKRSDRGDRDARLAAACTGPGEIDDAVGRQRRDLVDA